MNATLRIELLATCVPAAVETPFEDGSDTLSVLDTLCSALQESGCTDFFVGGFGQEKWPVDVETDLLTILEQLPLIVQAVESVASGFELDFFEQGIERRLTFERSGDELSVTCLSGTDWHPSPSTTQLPVSEFREMLSNLRGAFLRYAAARCPACTTWTGLNAWSAATRLT